MEVGLVTKIDIDQEMQQAYLDYAMSVIVARALPDARDGLKPVHRRILYAMHDMGMRPDTAYKKSARIVGEVLGKYHPHGDMAVYESMARMAQDFSMRYMLVDGQGNFGSLDDDPPAAMRYTEARLTNPAVQMLSDIGKNTVDFVDNFDGTLTEPTVLPAAIPNLLINGATGIAVGMATSIPPHNLGEVTEALHYMLENWEKLEDIGVEDLMQFVKGPDFPTGGVIIHEEGEDGLVAAYSTGRGRVTLQARAHLEEMERGRNRIIVNELPYMTYKAPLIVRIAELVREGRLEGIVDLRDESDRQGMRIVIELSKTADPEVILRDLYKHTPMQTTVSINMLALVGGEPRLLSLKQALRFYVEHRLEIVRRRGEYDLERARHRAHILEGLRIALKNLDEIIDLIRHAPDAETAHTRLMKKYHLSEIQAQAILDMPLKRLAALERKKIEDEYKEVVALIKSLEALLHSPKKMRQVIGEELSAAKEAYGDRRRTHIIGLKEGEKKTSLLTSNDILPDKMTWVSITGDGLISRTLDDKQPRLSGKEAPVCLARASTRDTLYVVCEQGETAALPVHAIPEAESPDGGTPLAKVSPLREGNLPAALFSVPPRSRGEEEMPFDKWNVLTVTRQGMIKKSALSELPGPSANTFTLVKVNEGDRLGWLDLTNGSNEVLLITATGMTIRFSEEEVRTMGLVAAGVMGIKLDKEDEVAGMGLLPKSGEVFMAASDGSAKRVKVDQFPKQGRYGQGVVGWKMPAKTQVIGLLIGRGTEHAIMHLRKLAAKSVRLDEAPLQSRTSRGAVIQEVKAGDQVVQIAIPWESPFLKGKGSPTSSEDTGKGSKSKKVASTKPAAKRAAPAAKEIKSAAVKGDKAAASRLPASAPVKGQKSAAAAAQPAPRATTKTGSSPASPKPASAVKALAQNAPAKPVVKAGVKEATVAQGPVTTGIQLPAKPAGKPPVKPAAKASAKDAPAPKTPAATGKKATAKPAGKPPVKEVAVKPATKGAPAPKTPAATGKKATAKPTGKSPVKEAAVKPAAKAAAKGTPASKTPAAPTKPAGKPGKEAPVKPAAKAATKASPPSKTPAAAGKKAPAKPAGKSLAPKTPAKPVAKTATKAAAKTSPASKIPAAAGKKAPAKPAAPAKEPAKLKGKEAGKASKPLKASSKSTGTKPGSKAKPASKKTTRKKKTPPASSTAT